MISEVAANWVTAIATLLAVAAALVIALYQEDWRERWRRKNLHPDLVVRAFAGPPDCVQIPHVEYQLVAGQPTSKRGTSYYLRMLVKNTGTVTARNVEVYAKALRQERNGNWEPVEDFPPMNLVWSNSPPEPHRDRTYLPFLPAGSSRHCDVAHMIDPQRRQLFESEAKPDLPPPSLTFDVVRGPLHFGHIVGPGKYRLDIEVAAENFDALTRVVEVWFDGTWMPQASQMFGYHLRIGVSSNCGDAQ